MYRTDPHCTRCTRIVSDGDLDVRFKHGDIIACSACDYNGVDGVILKPTPAEMRLPMRTPMEDNRLDPEIERRELQNIFFGSVIDFQKATLERLGCQPTLENRRQIRKAFMKATRSLIHAIVEAEFKARFKN